jgi:hypothetical protein
MSAYVSPIAPMNHQVQALQHFKKRPRKVPDVAALLMETGTGKTKVILEEFQEGVSNGTLDALLVIAPAGSVKNWYTDKSDKQPAEIKAHLDPALFRKLFVAAWNGPNEKYLLNIKDRPRALFINVEAFSAPKRGAEKLAVTFLRSSKCMLVLDESTRIRRKSLRTTAILRVKEYAKVRRIMSGFVTPKSPLDLYYQYEFLDNHILDYPTYTAFRARYAIIEKICYEPTNKIRGLLRTFSGLTDPVRHPDTKLRHNLKMMLSNNDHISMVDTLSRKQVLGALERAVAKADRTEMLDYIERCGGYVKVVPKIKEFVNLEELQKKIAPYSFQVLKKDCLDLKPKVYEPRDVELTRDQREIYDTFLKDAQVQLSKGHNVSAKNVIGHILKLHQIVCGHVKDELDQLLDIESNRIEAVLEVLEEHDGKAIIWSCYDPEIRKIVAAIKKEYDNENIVAAYWGGNKGTRDAEEHRFLSDDNCRFMVSTQPTGGTGNTWNDATLTVYAANSYDLEHRFQSEDRNHRKGQLNRVTYVDLITRNTVEERIIHALRNKIDLATKITGENYREWLI